MRGKDFLTGSLAALLPENFHIQTTEFGGKMLSRYLVLLQLA